jgi:hypothetical protein
MGKFFVAASAFLAASSLAMAAGMDGFYGNTLVIKDAKGAVLAKTQFKQDGTYETTRGTAAAVKGKWRVEGGAVCTKEDGAEDEECVDLKLDGKAKGQSWTVKGNGLDLALSVE